MSHSFDWRPSALVALLTLFFLQLLATWIESIYRVGLIKTSMGGEALGMLFVFAPLALYFVSRIRERSVLMFAIVCMLGARLAMPALSVGTNIVVAAIGVAAGVTVLAFAFSESFRIPETDFGVGVSVGVFLSIALRAWGSSVDLSLQSPGTIIGYLLVAASVVLAAVIKRPELSQDRLGQPVGSRWVLSISLFANVAILYWWVSCPAVLTAWTESNYVINVMTLLIAWTGAIASLDQLRYLRRATMLVWNLAFVGLMVGGIIVHTPSYPATMDAPAVISLSPSIAMQTSIHAMCLLSPVVLVNMTRIGGATFGTRPRDNAASMVVGMIVLTLLTVMAVFTNVWGYVGSASAAMRGKFYLPFLIAGGLMVLPDLIRSWSDQGRIPTRRRLWGSTATMFGIGLLGVTGILVRSWRSEPTHDSDQLTVLTYNMQLGSAPNGDKNYDQQLDLIREINPDIIGLQESDAARPGGGNIDLARLYGDALGYYFYYGPNSLAGTFGTALLSRYPIHNQRTVYSFSTKDQAGTAIGEVQIQGRIITIYNSHPAGKGGAKQAHMQDLIASIGSQQNVIAIGDYNMRQDTPEYQQISSRLTDSWISIYPDAFGQRHPAIDEQAGSDAAGIDMSDRIDHIFYTPDFRTVETYYLPVPQSETDHPAHWSVLRWDER